MQREGGPGTPLPVPPNVPCVYGSGAPESTTSAALTSTSATV